MLRALLGATGGGGSSDGPPLLLLRHLLRFRARRRASASAATAALAAPPLPLLARSRHSAAVTIAPVSAAASGARGGVPREQHLRLALRHAAPGLSRQAAQAVVAGAGRWPSLAQDAPALAARCAALARLVGAWRADALLRRAPDVLTRASSAIEAQLERAAAVLGPPLPLTPPTPTLPASRRAKRKRATTAAAPTITTTPKASPEAREAAVRLLTTAPQLLMLPPERLEQRVAKLAELLALPLPLPPGGGGGGEAVAAANAHDSWPRRLLAPAGVASASSAAAGAGWAVLPLGALAALTRALAAELGLPRTGGGGGGGGCNGPLSSSVTTLVLREPRLAELAAGAASPADVDASVRERLDALRQLLLLQPPSASSSPSSSRSAAVAALDAAVREVARAHPSLLILAPSDAQARLQRLVRALPEVWAAGLVRPRVAEAVEAAGDSGAAALAAAEGRCGPLAVDARALANSPALAALVLAPELDVARLEYWDHQRAAGGSGGGGLLGDGSAAAAAACSDQHQALNERLETVAWQVLRLDRAAQPPRGADTAAATAAEEDARFCAWAAARGIARRAPEPWGWADEFARGLRGPGDAFERWAGALQSRDSGWARGLWAWAAVVPLPPTITAHPPPPPPFSFAEFPVLSDADFDTLCAACNLPTLEAAVPPPTRDLSAAQASRLLAAAALGTEAPLRQALARHGALWSRVEGAAAGGPEAWRRELQSWREHLDAALLLVAEGGGGGSSSSGGKSPRQQQRALPASSASVEDQDAEPRAARRRIFWLTLERDLEPRLQRLQFLRQVAAAAAGEGDAGASARGAGPRPTAADAAAAKAAAVTASAAGLWTSLAATDRHFTRAHGPWRYGAWRRLSALVAPAPTWRQQLASARGARLERLLRLASGPRARRLEFLLHSIDQARFSEVGAGREAGGVSGAAASGALSWPSSPSSPPPPPPGDEWRAISLSDALEADDADFEASFPDSRFMAWRALAEMAGSLPLTTTMLPPLPVWPPPPPSPPVASLATGTAAVQPQQPQQQQYFYYFADRDEEDDENVDEEDDDDEELEEDEAEEEEDDDDAAASSPLPRRNRGRPRRRHVFPPAFYAAAPASSGEEDFLSASSPSLFSSDTMMAMMMAGGGGDSSPSSSSSSCWPDAAAAAADSGALVSPPPTPERIAEIAERAHRLVELAGRCVPWEREARALGVPGWRGLLHLFTPRAREPRLRFLLATGLAEGAVTGSSAEDERGASVATAGASSSSSLVNALRAPSKAFHSAFPTFAAWQLLVGAAGGCPAWRAELEAMPAARLRALLDDAVMRGSGGGGSAGTDAAAVARRGVRKRGLGAGKQATAAEEEEEEEEGGGDDDGACERMEAARLQALRQRLRHYSQYRRWTKTELSDIVRGTNLEPKRAAVSGEGSGGARGKRPASPSSSARKALPAAARRTPKDPQPLATAKATTATRKKK
jgi:hypothetical protein